MLVSCDKNSDTDNPVDKNLIGSYMGTFHRTGMDTVGLILSFSENNFEGSSTRPKYPAICRGSFQLNTTTVTFTDSCVWTADFDWTLILNGNYNIDFNSDGSIRIWRTYGSVSDEYLIRRPIR